MEAEVVRDNVTSSHEWMEISEIYLDWSHELWTKQESVELTGI